MTIEETRELEDSIKEKRGVYPPWTKTVCSLGCGIDIIRKYQTSPEYNAQYDIIHYGNWAEDMTKEDLTKLFEMNWGIDNEYSNNNFYHFT